MSSAISNLASTSTSNVKTANTTSLDTKSTSTQSLKTLSNNFGSFLKLLTTQLKNQDPLSPMKTHEFTNQLVMFAEAEQAISTNKKLDTLIGINQKSEAAQALSYHGREVRVKGDRLSFNGDPVKLQYTAPTGMASGEMIIKDSAGKTVYTKKLDATQIKQGEHSLSWDGRNQYGYQLAKGLYKVSIAGKAASGNTLSVTNLSTTGSVKGVEYKDGQTWLNMGYFQVKLADVSSITTNRFSANDKANAIKFVGSNVMLSGATAAVKNGKLSLAYNTNSTTNFKTALNGETLKTVKLKFYGSSGNLLKTEDITSKITKDRLIGGDKRIDMSIPTLADGNYRVDMEVAFNGANGATGSTFNNIPMGYAGKVRRVVFKDNEVRLEINDVLYDPRNVNSVLNSDTPIYNL